jgi:monothiol glutaredoxin
MQRNVLPTAQVHPAICEKISTYHAPTIDIVKNAIARNDVVVVGMKMNPFPGRARRLLNQLQVPYHYLEWGSYLSQWKPRLAIKLWTGWSTFPQIFVKGTLIGGFSELQRLVESGELTQLLAAPGAK